ncbi:MAG: endonuclease [Bacteroidales bacterium]|nr:endonuclease [Bacteroidales bacterium]
MRPLSLLKVPLLFLLFIEFQIVASLEAVAQEKGDFRVAFWNFENFFDPFVDSTRVYNEFTENGSQHWTKSRFYKKRNNMYKAILAISENEPLAVLGIAEVENQYVLNMLFNQTPLKTHNYRIVHYEGDDKRGIDVALVYCIDKLQLVYTEPVKVKNPKNRKYKTRDILYAKFYDRRGDTLHVFVNHWPSRYGGERETIKLRSLAANTLKHKVDSLVFLHQTIPKVIIMGDFNDTPEDPSIKDILCYDVLVNLFADGNKLGFEGTLKHQYTWQIFDQIIVTNSLINNDKGLVYRRNSAAIFHGDFLFEKDESFGGVKLFRTYVGPKYFGGYSDHLPVYIDLIFR